MGVSERKKIILIPGWMNGRGMYGRKYEVLEIWKERINFRKRINSDIVIAHSLSCNWALANWENHQNTHLILVNPLLPRRSIGIWFLRWIKFHLEEIKPESKEVVEGVKNKLFGFKICLNLLRRDFDKVLDNIPKEDIIVLNGRNDYFYCDEKFKEYIKSKNIKIVEVEGSGHDWNDNIEREIEKIVNNK